MEKSTSTKQKKYDEWEVRDAMHTVLRAGSIVKDKTLMGHVRKHAAKHAAEKADEAARARSLAKKGLISDKAMAKHVTKGKGGNQGGSVAALDKTRPTA